MKTFKELMEEIAAIKILDSYDIEEIYRVSKEVSDAYSKLLAEQRERAEKCRYHKMAAEIIGDKEHLYFGDYDGGMRYTFGSDETEV